MTLDLQAGAVISDVFSRTIAIEAPGFDPNVRRVSGTASYKFTKIHDDPSAYEFACSYNYDGLQSGENQGQILDRGRVQCYDGKCAPVTDASGVVLNPEFWGELPANAHVGTSWAVELKMAWELGPPGKQEITVISLDPGDHLIILKREGKGAGDAARERKQITLTKQGKSYSFESRTGEAHWVGYTIIQKGVIISDELMSQRTLTLISTETGQVKANERQYILLSRIPS